MGFLFFAWIPPLSSVRRRRAALITTHHSLTLTHSLPPSLARSLTHSLLTTHYSQPTTHYSLLTTHYSLLTSLTSLTHSLTHSLRQAQYRELAFCVADALHRASWRSCGARGRRWGRGCLSGRRSTQSLWTSCAVHRASWTSCGARGRRWGRGCLWRGRRSTQSLLDELRRAWPPLGPRLPFAWQAQYTEPPKLRRASPPLPLAWQAQYTEPPGRAAARVAAAGGRGCLSRGRRSTQSLHIIFDTLSFSHKFVSHHLSDTILDTPTLTHHLSHHFVPHHLSHTALSHTILHKPLCHTLSFTHHQHHLSHTTLPHTIFHTPLCHTLSFTHRFVTHHLSHPICDTPSLSALCHTPSTPSFTHHLWHSIFHTQLCHTLFFTHHLSHTPLSHTIFDTTSLTHTHTIFHTPSQTIFCTPSFTHNFVTHHLWHTFFHTQLCHTPSFTTPSLSHTIFSRRQLCHTPSFLHLFLCLSFLPRPRNKISCSILEEVDLWGYPVLLFFLNWTWGSKLWKLMVGTTIPKKPFYKTKGAGPASIDILSDSSTIKSEIGTPNIGCPDVSKYFLKSPFWKAWFYSGPGRWL